MPPGTPGRETPGLRPGGARSGVAAEKEACELRAAHIGGKSAERSQGNQGKRAWEGRRGQLRQMAAKR